MNKQAIYDGVRQGRQMKNHLDWNIEKNFFPASWPSNVENQTKIVYCSFDKINTTSNAAAHNSPYFHLLTKQHSIFAVPSTPRNVSYCLDETKTHQICVSWMKPNGGNEINEYLLSWTNSDNEMFNAKMDHLTSTDSYKHIMRNLQPGETITLNIKARNDKGNGSETKAQFRTSESSFETI